MAFTVKDFHDLVRILEQHPEWRAELRKLLLPEELLSLPQLVQELGQRIKDLSQEVTRLVEAQRRAEERLARAEERLASLEVRADRLEQALERLAEAQRRSEERLAKAEERLAGVEVRVDRLEQALERLAEAQRRTEEQVSELALTVRQLVIDVGDLKGEALERRYRERAFSYFAPILRRIRVIPGEELMEKLEQAMEKALLSQKDAEELAQADLVVRGIHRELGEEVYLLVEVSWGIGRTDVERAFLRAQALSRIGMRALPVVAGKAIAPEAQEEAKERGVWQILDGQVLPP